jgi:hypothetical protein
VTSSALSCGLEASLFRIPLASAANSFSGIANSVKPQFMQARSFGNTQTIGLSKPSRPGKWTIISAPNSSGLSAAHDLQLISPPYARPWSLIPEVLSYLSVPSCLINCAIQVLEKSDDEIAWAWFRLRNAPDPQKAQRFTIVSSCSAVGYMPPNELFQESAGQN